MLFQTSKMYFFSVNHKRNLYTTLFLTMEVNRNFKLQKSTISLFNFCAVLPNLSKTYDSFVYWCNSELYSTSLDMGNLLKKSSLKE